jgi:hypothetical protein
MDPKQIVRDLLYELPDDVSLHDIARKVAYVAAVREVLPTKPLPASNARFASYLDSQYWRRLSGFVAVLSALVSGLGFLTTPPPSNAWTELALAILFGDQALFGQIGPRLRRVASKRRIRIAVAISLVMGMTTFITVFLAYRKLPWAGPVSALALLFACFGPILLVRLPPRSNFGQRPSGA